MNLDVLIPSLLLPAPMHKLLSPPIVPALERLLARADRQLEVTPAGSSWLFEHWGVVAPYPFAPLLAEYDGLDASNDAWMLAEPVHLAPEGKLLKLFPARFLELKATETAVLIADLNTHFADRHLQFIAPTHDRWYVRCSPSEIPGTTSTDAARFSSLADFQPKSTGALDWRSLQNEAQMLFFGHPVNDAREVTGKPTVSGVWFWGGGILPKLKRPTYDSVVANSPLATQFAKKTAIDVLPLSWDSIQSAQGNVLAVIDSCAEFAGNADLLAWERELGRLDREWFLPMSQALGKGEIQRLNIHVPGNGSASSFHLTRRNHLLRFWRTAMPLSSYA